MDASDSHADAHIQSPKFALPGFLRALAILVVVGGLIAAYYSLRVNDEEQALEALHARTPIEVLRGRSDWVSALDAEGPAIGDAEVQEIAKLRHLQALKLDEAKITDAGLKMICSITTLERLEIDNVPISDVGIEEFARLHALHWLSLEGSGITDAQLAKLTKMNRLVTLNLGSTRVTDAGLAALSGLTRLEHLVLSDNEITDAAIDHLDDLAKTLKLLDVSHTKITSDGLTKLRKALPATAITFHTD